MRRESIDDEGGQMLLMTGLVLMFSLLTMSLTTVKTASLGEPYDGNEDAVLDTSVEVVEAWQPLLQNRTPVFFNAGYNETSASVAAAESVSEDLMRHGELRPGVEIILTDITVTGNGSTRMISASAGIADSHSRLQLQLSATVNFT